jgi:hypothetical protein
MVEIPGTSLSLSYLGYFLFCSAAISWATLEVAPTGIAGHGFRGILEIQDGSGDVSGLEMLLSALQKGAFAGFGRPGAGGSGDEGSSQREFAKWLGDCCRAARVSKRTGGPGSEV